VRSEDSNLHQPTEKARDGSDGQGHQPDDDHLKAGDGSDYGPGPGARAPTTNDYPLVCHWRSAELGLDDALGLLLDSRDACWTCKYPLIGVALNSFVRPLKDSPSADGPTALVASSRSVGLYEIKWSLELSLPKNSSGLVDPYIKSARARSRPVQRFRLAVDDSKSLASGS
jgi:hypothetical protein